MFKSPYETLACRMYQVQKLGSQLEVANMEEQLVTAELNDKTIVGVKLVYPLNREVSPFAHPFPLFKDGQFVGVVVDARGMTRIDQRAGELQVISPTEYEFSVIRASLTRYAIINGGEDLMSLGNLPITVFSRFLAENITRRLGLGPEEQAQITMVSAFYYLCLLREPGELEERDIQRMTQKVSSATYIPANWIFDNIGEVEYMGDMNAYVAVLKRVVKNRRIEDISPALLISMLGGGWFGSNAKEVVAVALEHPQTLIAMIYLALKDRSYRNSGLAKVVLACDRRDIGKVFLRNVLTLVEVTDA